ncbi:MAG TPA: hypothetical protein VMT90_06290 [Dehalococcoidia bacterium]|jgi:flavin-binding protein dodecin|nr:hypothetical protein [Dehalococcoidia bacterium]
MAESVYKVIDLNGTNDYTYDALNRLAFISPFGVVRAALAR